MSKDPFPPGKGVAALDESIRRLAKGNQWDVRVPLPTTRELGERYGISNASVCRLLKKLDSEKAIWRRDNGRYYPTSSRSLYERRKPYACLLRKLESWSVIYQAIMAGFARAVRPNKGAILFIHDETLFRRPDPANPPLLATAAEQRESLQEFFRYHDRDIGGIVLDQVWLDEVLEEFAPRLANAVIVCRPSRLARLSSVSADLKSSGIMAVAHLYARGYEEIWLAVPFAHSINYDLMVKAAMEAAAAVGRPIERRNHHSVATPADRERFVARIKAAKKRIGVYCVGGSSLPVGTPSYLRQCLAEAGLSCPEQVGLLAGMSIPTEASDRISSFQVDYGEMGRIAGEILATGQRKAVTVPAQLVFGATT